MANSRNNLARLTLAESAADRSDRCGDVRGSELRGEMNPHGSPHWNRGRGNALNTEPSPRFPFFKPKEETT